MDSVEDYARRWAKSEKEELESLQEWVKSIRSILKSRIKHVRSKMRTNYPSAFNKSEVIRELNRLQVEYVLVPADKSSLISVYYRPVRIRVRIDLPHTLVCRKRRLNAAVLRMRPEKPSPRVTAGVAR
jgi:hypothetical protein